MSDEAVARTASWLDGTAPSDAKPGDQLWACVEIFGHRKHYGRVSEVEKFGAKMLRVDVPTKTAAPLLGEAEEFETFVYGGGAIFSLTPMTEEAARKWAEHERPSPQSRLARLPPPRAADWLDDVEDEEVSP